MNQTDASNAAVTPSLSVIVPLYNELENVAPLVDEIHAALANHAGGWELILVDDGSRDGTDRRVLELAEKFPHTLRYLLLQRNFGQTAAMQAGIDAARGALLVTLDGDLQNDPADIPRLIAHLERHDLDMVVGWRRERKDNLFSRTLPSRIANALIGRLSGVRLHDYGCSLKVYRASVIKGVQLYGEMHRFIPAWVATRTAPHRIDEMAVHHRARVHGESKYGIGRTFRVIVDLLSVYFFMNFLTRPGHFFGRIGLGFGALGIGALGWLMFVKYVLGEAIGHRPLLIVGVLLCVVSAQFLSTGVLAEMLSRVYFASGRERAYVVRRSNLPDLRD
ncbi:MAG: glycosyltransferase family 2 protein [Chromatiales bacterium]|nr:glycosyltransferase family 2 protein [Chromatiales bacterium]